jgi:hypothetical protein
MAAFDTAWSTLVSNLLDMERHAVLLQRVNQDYTDVIEWLAGQMHPDTDASPVPHQSPMPPPSSFVQPSPSSANAHVAIADVSSTAVAAPDPLDAILKLARDIRLQDQTVCALLTFSLHWRTS